MSLSDSENGDKDEKDITYLQGVYEEACKAVERPPIQKLVTFLDAVSNEFEPDIDGYTVDLSGILPEHKYNRLSSQDIIALSRALSEDFLISDLNLSYNDLGNEGAIALGKSLQDNRFLEKLDVSMCDIDVKGVEALCTGLQMNDHLTGLNLCGNKIGRQGGILISASLQVNSTLNSLNLACTDQNNESLIALTTVMLDNTSIKKLDVSSPLLTSEQEETTIHFGRMLRTNYGLTELRLCKHGMKDYGASQLAESLKDNKTLVHLNLSCNKITEDGAKAFSNLLKLNTPLKELSLCSNRIGNNGVVALSEALATYNCNLNKLWLTNNNINEAGLCALAASLRSNITLSNVYIWGNDIGNSACNAFSELMKGSSPRLLDWNTDVVPYVVDGVTYLSETGQYLFSH